VKDAEFFSGDIEFIISCRASWQLSGGKRLKRRNVHARLGLAVVEGY